MTAVIVRQEDNQIATDETRAASHDYCFGRKRRQFQGYRWGYGDVCHCILFTAHNRERKAYVQRSDRLRGLAKTG